MKNRISLRFGIGLLQLLQSRHKSFRNVAAPIGAKTAGNGVDDCAHDFLFSLPRVIALRG